MQLEDSYEGAVRRLSRLSNAGIGLREDIDSRDEARAQRMRDLEELATLAADENERLEKDNQRLTQENKRLERELSRAKETLSRMQQTVLESDREKLRELVEAPPEVAEKRERRSVLPHVAVTLMMVLIAGTSYFYRPWKYVHPRAMAKQLVTRYSMPWLAPHDPVSWPAPQPVVAAPVAPMVQPAVAPVVKPVEAAPAPEKKAHASKKHHHHNKVAAAKKEKPAKAAAAKASSDDPLLGL